MYHPVVSTKLASGFGASSQLDGVGGQPNDSETSVRHAEDRVDY